MTQKEAWGPWIEHDGKGCPVRGKFCQVVIEGLPGQYFENVGIACLNGPGESWDWSNWLRRIVGEHGLGLIGRVVRYRVRRDGFQVALDALNVEKRPELEDA